MHICLFDDSIPFDGYTPGSQPLGGAEKAFASLPGALVRRGHEVTVFNRCRFRMLIEGAQWMPWDEPRPAQADVLIAFRKPGLLGAIRNAGRRVLWVTAPARYLAQPASRKLLDAMQPALVFQGPAHHATWSGGRYRALTIAPGIRWDYLADKPMEPAAPPRAVVTTHPLHGLSWLLDLWVTRIHPEMPAAELHIYSMTLDRGAQGGEVAEELKPVLAQALAAAPAGVVIKRPKGDGGMAEEYRAARVHLYPGHGEDMTCFTLAESQAAGLPAVARDLGAVRERLRDGETGWVVPDGEAFANVALRLLGDEALFHTTSTAARTHQRGRTWDAVARDFEQAWE